MTKASMAIIAEVKKYISDRRIILPGEKVLAAVSGGADSVCLFHILHRIAGELGISVLIAHFDHGTRGEQSAAEAREVGVLAERFGVGFIRGEALCLPRSNYEDEARRARYRFLFGAAREAGADIVATGHHMDDQAETVLLHLLRGAGTEGLHAISPREGLLARPILCLSRAQTELYCRENGLGFALDQSNDEVEYLRNRIRHHLLPGIKKDYNPQITRLLAQTADIRREESALLETLSLNTGIYDYAAPLCLRRLAVRRAYRERFLGELSLRHTETLLNLAEGREIYLPGGVKAMRMQGELRFLSAGGVSPGDSAAWTCPVVMGSGTLRGGWTVCCSKEVSKECPKEGFAEDSAASGGQTAITLQSDCLPYLKWRGREEGDRLAFEDKAGIIRHKKIKEIFINAKIPRIYRADWPLLTLNGEVIWAPFLSAAARAAENESVGDTDLITVRVGKPPGFAP